jgi:hypothetical protein
MVQGRTMTSMFALHHDMARALVETHQRDLHHEAATRRFARMVRRSHRHS